MVGPPCDVTLSLSLLSLSSQAIVSGLKKDNSRLRLCLSLRCRTCLLSFLLMAGLVT